MAQMAPGLETLGRFGTAHIPEADRHVVAAGGERFAVRVVSDGGDRFLVAAEGRLLLRFLAGDVVESSEVIEAGDGQGLAVRCEGHAVDMAGRCGDREAEL